MATKKKKPRKALKGKPRKKAKVSKAAKNARTAKPKARKKRWPKNGIEKPIYVYAPKAVHAHAKKQGNMSAYVTRLIKADMGAKPARKKK